MNAFDSRVKMKVLELARRRKTVRKFERTEVRLETVLKIIEAARQAPSGANRQPWRFLVVRDPSVKRRIREAAEEGEREFYKRVQGELKEWLRERGFSPDKPFLEEAPILILVFSDVRSPYHTQSTWLAIGFMLLAIEEAGLGTVTYTPSNPELVSRVVDSPDGLKLEAILPIGLPADDKPKERRRSLREICFLDSWETPCPE